VKGEKATGTAWDQISTACCPNALAAKDWIPTFAGMIKWGGNDEKGAGMTKTFGKWGTRCRIVSPFSLLDRRINDNSFGQQ
jgi:hypothetical protein